jgi:predicted RNA-binding Zn-ribbon protein involved in translation (DUF1610 family)
MENQYIGSHRCFLCNKKARLKPVTDAYYFIDCPNCGQYTISDVAIVTKAYNSKKRYLLPVKVIPGESFAATLSWSLEKLIERAERRGDETFKFKTKDGFTVYEDIVGTLPKV